MSVTYGGKASLVKAVMFKDHSSKLLFIIILVLGVGGKQKLLMFFLLHR